MELYLARGADRSAIEVSCAGTLVADDAGELRAQGMDRSPWVGRGGDVIRSNVRSTGEPEARSTSHSRCITSWR